PRDELPPSHPRSSRPTREPTAVPAGEPEPSTAACGTFGTCRAYLTMSITGNTRSRIRGRQVSFIQRRRNLMSFGDRLGRIFSLLHSQSARLHSIDSVLGGICSGARPLR